MPGQTIPCLVKPYQGPFWLLPPPPVCKPLIDSLALYAAQSSSIAHVGAPAAAAFLPLVRGSKDSATGVDGIPYAVYRLIDVQTSALLESFLQALVVCPTSLPVPSPLLVWIPKAAAGPRSDNWRPLGMPSTLHRLLAAGVYYHLVNLIPSLLHPSQALLNVFREPQANFRMLRSFSRYPMRATSG